MHVSVFLIAALVGSGLVAGFFDSIVGGSGVITLPTLLWAGLSPYAALGTNKLAGTFASSISTLTYMRSGRIHWSLIRGMIPFTLVGAWLGATTVLHVNQRYLQLTIFFAIVIIAILTLVRRSLGKTNAFAGVTTGIRISSSIAAFALGFYDGFIGPGTGSFLLFLFLSAYRFDFVLAAGNGRVLNFASNIAALVYFALHGEVALLEGLPMGIAMMIGARIGSKMAVKRGVPFIRPLFVVVSLVLAIKMAITVFH
ncbi:TSUP family transporter [Ferroacidibacillus organovorans]|uniref:Probable membrane transporter protein n=2 Tax=Ferroacidibacillus organovorans TaxID=1765683 RepID=A0A1V4EQY4_9BACL|nr:TSUP family transporter [Ferroacidibacillus organovorans]OPG15336.1 hypothetical protein B2M26_12820 [Ferroacidibacillus organovorans]